MEKLAYLVGLALVLFFGTSDAAVTYTRWGRSTCPDGVHKLYSGYMVGAGWNQPGSGANHVCTPEKPKNVNTVAGNQDWTGHLWGVEFEIPAPLNGLFSTENLPAGSKLQDQDALCVVCYVDDASTQIMIPGTDDCYNTGFDLQYKGFLVAQVNKDGRSRAEYICMDEAPEGRIGGTANNNQAVIYPVQYMCGSLPCNPYVNGLEAACAVCTY